MDVGINLRDLRGSGRLSALARALGVNEAEALGTLIIVWAETQDRELVVVSEEQFSDSVSLYFDDASKILGAMAKAKLVSRCQPEKWHIHGNEKHVTKLQAFRANASAAGKASATARQRLRSQAVAKPEHIGTESTGNNLAAKPLTPWQHLGNQAVDEPPPNLNGLITKPLTPRQRLDNQGPTLDTGIQDTGDQDHDLQISDPSSPRVQTSEISDPRAEGAKSAPPARVGGLSATARIRSAYLRGYEQRFGRPFVGWGAKSNGQAAHLQRDWPADRIVELIELFFAWNNPRAIAAGFPFSFFVTAIHELDADTHSPERKRQARVLDAAEHQIGRKDAEQLTLEAELAQIRARRARAATHNETLTKGLQPVKQAVKQVFAASAPQLTRGGVDELVG